MIERNYTLDLLRILAVLAVIMIHVSACFVANYDYHSSQFIIGNFFDSISRFAVPFFLIISGYLMLNEHKIIPEDRFRYKIIKLFVILVFWSLFYSLIYNFNNFFHSFLYGGHYHLWFLYMIIGLYFLTPIFKLFANRENKKYLYYTIFLGVVFCFIPNLLNSIFPPAKASDIFSQYGLSGFGYSIYYLIGGLFSMSINKVNLKTLFLIVLLSWFSILCSVQFIHYHDCNAYQIFYNNLNLPVLVYSVSLFLFIYNIFNKIVYRFPLWCKNVLSKCSSLTLGVYLIHASIIHLFERYALIGGGDILSDI